MLTLLFLFTLTISLIRDVKFFVFMDHDRDVLSIPTDSWFFLLLELLLIILTNFFVYIDVTRGMFFNISALEVLFTVLWCAIHFRGLVQYLGLFDYSERAIIIFTFISFVLSPVIFVSYLMFIYHI